VATTLAGRPGGSVPSSLLAYSEEATLPMTATPRVPPNSRVDPLTAEARPAFSAGTAPSASCAVGACVSPSPAPTTTSWATRMAYGVACDSRDVQNIASPSKARPAPMTTLLPMRTASRVPATEVTTTAAASGSNRTPVPSGL
jgi:hypothetical protein